MCCLFLVWWLLDVRCMEIKKKIGVEIRVEVADIVFLGPTRGPKTFYRWQKGKLILLASLSCWIIFTLPLGFFQPPGVKCMVWKNNSYWLEDAGQTNRVKRSLETAEFYDGFNEEDHEADLEVAENVVFEQLRRKRRSLDDNGHKRIQRQADFNYKQFSEDDKHDEAKDIDFRSIAKSNRPADVLEYKKFLQVLTSSLFYFFYFFITFFILS